MKLKTMRIILEAMEKQKVSDIHIRKELRCMAITKVEHYWVSMYIATGTLENGTITMRVNDYNLEVESITKTTEEKL